MRLGGPILDKDKLGDPALWVAALRERGYTAAWPPLAPTASDDYVNAFARAAADADILIAEVGAWSNPISPDANTAAAAMTKCINVLALAERVGARCCVNIVGSRNVQKWDGPHPDNFTAETFDMIVASVRGIIDAVKPTRTSYTLEMMPWIFPSSPDECLALIKAIDRKAFGVHLDPVNIVNSPQRYYRTGDLIRECFDKLGPYIKSCHAKDTLLSTKLTVHLDEVRPGLGNLDYAAYLTGLSKLDPDTPLMMEHMPDDETYRLGAAHIREVARQQGVQIR